MMLVLSSQEMLHIWEIGLGHHPIDQALIILAAAFPETSRDTLAELSIGQRDSYLLAVRAHTFGSRLVVLATCPQCRDQVECVLDIAAMGLVAGIGAEAPTPEADKSAVGAINRPLRFAGDAGPPIRFAGDAGSPIRFTGEDAELNKVQQVRVDGYEVYIRLPNSLDLAAIANDNDVGSARKRLVQCCIAQSYHDGLPLSAESLPETVIEVVTAQMVERDPLAEIQLDLTCPACDHHWNAMFDIATFLWREISTEAKRLLREVHILAQAYGWREADILSMSAARRQLYMEMVT
ncbi:MAG: phage baseplate protein [Chloroflexi bacterium]|nr:MAG: phage baseplate protein [Chloroflexota bacterium]